MADTYTPQGGTLVTGGLGFIFSYYVSAHLEKWPESKVVVLDKEDYCSNRKNLDLVRDMYPGQVHIVKGDVRDMDLVRYILQQENIDTVVHAAAVSHVDHSFSAPLIHNSVNTYGSHCMLETIRKYNRDPETTTPVRRILFVSSDEVMGDNESVLDEESVLKPTNPYSASKAAAEMFASAYKHSYDLPIIITRGNNVYGPRQYPEKVIPKFCMLLNRNKPLTVHGNGSQTRSMMYVTDAARAYQMILERGELGHIYNIEANCEKSVIDIAEQLVAIHRAECHQDCDSCDSCDCSTTGKIVYVRDRDYNDSNYRVNGNKLTSLGFIPEVDFETGLKKTYEWYRTYGANYWRNEAVESALQAHPTLQTYVH
jgi:dTDP-glucose 4,6-dehydratase